MSDYPVQPIVTAFNAVTLTASYAGNEFELPVEGMSKLSIDIDYAQGATESGNICHFKIEHSTDGTNWYSLVVDDTTGGVSDLVAREWNITGDATLNLILDIAYSQIRISAKESLVASNYGTMTMVVVTSGK